MFRSAFWGTKYLVTSFLLKSFTALLALYRLTFFLAASIAILINQRSTFQTRAILYVSLRYVTVLAWFAGEVFIQALSNGICS